MRNFARRFCPSACLILLAGLGYVGVVHAFQFESGKKAKVKGAIVSRSGDLVKIRR